MQKQTHRSTKLLKTVLTWIPALWSIEAIGIYTGIVIGAIAEVELAVKPFLETGKIIPAIIWTVFSIGITFIPVAAVIRLHYIIKKTQSPRTR